MIITAANGQFGAMAAVSTKQNQKAQQMLRENGGDVFELTLNN